MLNVYITVDTEVWWSDPRLGAFRADFDRWFRGATPGGAVGAPFKAKMLSDYGLKGGFFVEPLFADAVGPDYLAEMVEALRAHDQFVELHAHSEWLRLIPEPIVPPRTGDHIRCHTEDEQAALLERGLELLRAAGAEEIMAFRAGNYGASLATLRALKRVGVPVDTSYNYCYLGAACDMAVEPPLMQPASLEGVIEAPIGFFADYPGHFRHLQLTACSFEEIRHALLQAHARGWTDLVLVSHSFELMNSGRDRPDPLMLERFERLCAFLRDNADKFRTPRMTPEMRLAASQPTEPLKGELWNTGGRFLGQLKRRVLYNKGAAGFEPDKSADLSV